MEKLFILLLIAFSATSCGPNSSPEGRMTNNVKEIHQELDSLKKQHAMILDRLGKIGEHLQRIEERK